MTDRSAQPLRLGPDDIGSVVAAARSPQVTARAALVVDMDAAATLYAQNPNDPLPPASTAKVMTALLVLQRAATADTVTVSEAAAATGGSTMNLVAGERLTVEQLLYGLLLPSGNDAAVALAEHVSGTESAFVVEMNQTAAKMGLRSSHFANAHGLDADGQTVSASDLVTLTAAALEYPLFRTIVATSSASIAGHALTNTNELLGQRPEVDGVKTGTTDEGGECLIVSATRNGHRLLAAVLGSRDRYADIAALLDFAEKGWSWRPAALPDDGLAWARGSDGRPYRLRSLATSDIFVPTWQAVLLRPLRVISDTAVMTSTLPVGELRWTVGGRTLASTPLGVWQGP